MEALWRRGIDLGQLLPLCSAIREGMPEMKRIWEYSPMAEERNRIVQEILDFEDEYRSKLKRGECTLKDVVCPVVSLTLVLDGSDDMLMTNAF